VVVVTQLGLFTEPPAPALPSIAGSIWTQFHTRPGKTVRQIRVKAFDGRCAVVVPTNFVDDAWPWTGRALTVEQIERDWRMTHAPRNP